ncbi:MAG: hypothetical protein J0L97_03510 [Alphaproteobacteria bacterium]|nr:hypothetical protein [Alphaproteobacteria bacterium]
MSRVRGRGIFRDGDDIVINWGDNPPDDSDHVYLCHLPLSRTEEHSKVDVDTVLRFMQLLNWKSPSEPYLLLGWAAVAVMCGALPWRPHLFITGPKNSGKTTLIVTLMGLLKPIGLTLDGGSTEAGIRQKLGADSRPVALDEFESDQNSARMKAVVKLMRSASSAEYSMVRGTPEGTALEFCIRSTFLLAAINPTIGTAADRSRVVILTLGKHNNDKEVSKEITALSRELENAGPAWCALVIKHARDILAGIQTLRSAFPPLESRHVLNMATLLAGGWVMLNRREMNAEDAETLIAEHRDLINGLAAAHDDDDAVECLNALLGYQTRNNHSIGMMLLYRKRGETVHEYELERHGIRWKDGGFLVANRHPSIKQVYEGTQWADGYVEVTELGWQTKRDERSLLIAERLLHEGLLHPSILRRIKQDFRAGLYDKAVQDAFKQVEVETRIAAGLEESVTGEAVFKRAFDTQSPLRKACSKPDVERNFFSSSYNVHRHHPSHNNTKLEPQEAAQMLVLASQLLYRLEALKTDS